MGTMVGLSNLQVIMDLIPTNNLIEFGRIPKKVFSVGKILYRKSNNGS